MTKRSEKYTTTDQWSSCNYNKTWMTDKHVKYNIICYIITVLGQHSTRKSCFQSQNDKQCRERAIHMGLYECRVSSPSGRLEQLPITIFQATCKLEHNWTVHMRWHQQDELSPNNNDVNNGEETKLNTLTCRDCTNMHWWTCVPFTRSHHTRLCLLPIVYSQSSVWTRGISQLPKPLQNAIGSYAASNRSGNCGDRNTVCGRKRYTHMISTWAFYLHDV